jgi:hypothetical protein
LTIDPTKLPGIVLDDESLERHGTWQQSSSVGGFVGAGYWHDAHEGTKTARFTTRLKAAGVYEVRMSYTPNANRATNAAVTVHHAEGDTTIKVNQRLTPPISKAFVSLGKFRFEKDREAAISITNSGADGHVIVDAVQFLLAP